LPPHCESRLTAIAPPHKAKTMEIKLGDRVRLKKKHPCGSDEWEVVRVGADIGIKCLKCQRRVLLERSVFERRLKTFVSHREK
jgi:hypothetical protein